MKEEFEEPVMVVMEEEEKFEEEPIFEEFVMIEGKGTCCENDEGRENEDYEEI